MSTLKNQKKIKPKLCRRMEIIKNGQKSIKWKQENNREKSMKPKAVSRKTINKMIRLYPGEQMGKKKKKKGTNMLTSCYLPLALNSYKTHV